MNGYTHRGMKDKTIVKVLKKKHNQFLESIRDEDLRKKVENNSFITGGCIASMLAGDKVNDYDIYFTNKQTVIDVCEYYAKEFGQGDVVDIDSIIDSEERKYYEARGFSSPGRVGVFVVNKQDFNGVSEDEQEQMQNVDPEVVSEKSQENDEKNDDSSAKFFPVYLSPNAISLSHKVQLITRFYGDPAEIHKNYDFEHCKCYWIPGENKIHYTNEALRSIMSKSLLYTGSLYPVASVIRTRKFINRGWTCHAGNYIKMCLQISKLDLSNPATLEDQLTGVDIGFFIQLIDALKAKKASEIEAGNNSWVPIDNYICEIVDRLFN